MLNDLIVGRAILGSHRDRYLPRHSSRLRAWLRHVLDRMRLRFAGRRRG